MTIKRLKSIYDELSGTETVIYADDGDMVNYEDHMAVVSKLIAENAALKKFCKNAAFDADYEAELGMEVGGFTDALNDIKTPITDAFLAEVMAQGVDMAAQSDQFSAWVKQQLHSFAIGVRQGEK